MERYIIRHGQSVNNAGAQEWDPVLTAAGHEQAHLTGRYLLTGRLEPWQESRSLTAIVCSPLRRAVQTSLGIGASHDCPIIVHPSIHETMGPEPGLMVVDEVRELFPTVSPHPSFPAGRWWPERNETEDDRVARAESSVRFLRDEYAGAEDTVVVVTHGTFGSYLINALLGVGPRRAFRAAQHNCGIAKIVDEEGLPALHFHNELEHLPEHLRT